MDELCERYAPLQAPGPGVRTKAGRKVRRVLWVCVRQEREYDDGNVDVYVDGVNIQLLQVRVHDAESLTFERGVASGRRHNQPPCIGQQTERLGRETGGRRGEGAEVLGAQGLGRTRAMCSV